MKIRGRTTFKGYRQRGGRRGSGLGHGSSTTHSLLNDLLDTGYASVVPKMSILMRFHISEDMEEYSFI